VTEIVIEVGPATIRGPNEARAEWVSVALECIDDGIALLDDHPVPVRDLWDEVMGSVAGTNVDTAVLVCPAWWPSTRIDTARDAAHTVAAEVVVLGRSALLREGIPADTVIVEITAEIAVVTVSGTIGAVVTRQDEPSRCADAVAAAIGAPAGVLVDAPTAVPGAELLASSIAVRMRAIGVPVRIADDAHVSRAAAAHRACVQVESPGALRRSGVVGDRKALAALSGVLSAALLCGGVAVLHDGDSARRVDDMPMTLLVEGRIAVLVPATWTAQRITSGPGSARVQVVSPTGDIALHITQSATAQASSLAMTADSLRAALGESADGVFVDFNPSDRRADRDAVTYREVRPERDVAWTVVVDGTARIAIGCQSAPGGEHLVQQACDRAIRSAHTVVEK
jgi:type VII secretion-associated protein (TIGR03931 family)